MKRNIFRAIHPMTTDQPDAPSEGVATDDVQAANGAAPDANAERIALLEAEKIDLRDKLLRSLADIENLRRRSEREIADARSYAVSNFARDMLTVADNMRRALES